MLMDKELSKAKLPKIVQSRGFLGALLGKFAILLIKVAVLLAENVFTLLANIYQLLQ